MLDWAEKEFKVATMSRFENVKVNSVAKNEHVENYNREIEMIRKNKIVILELKIQ